MAQPRHRERALAGKPARWLRALRLSLQASPRTTCQNHSSVRGRFRPYELEYLAASGKPRGSAGFRPDPAPANSSSCDEQPGLRENSRDHVARRYPPSRRERHARYAALSGNGRTTLEQHPACRSSANYRIVMLGEPGAARWGWMLTGHHLAANFTVVNGQVAFHASLRARLSADDRIWSLRWLASPWS